MPNNPNATDNLIPAKAGEVRNPKGKPKGRKSFKTVIGTLFDIALEVDTKKDYYRQIRQVMPELLKDGQKISVQDLVTIRAVADAVAGKNPDKAREFLADRYEGKPKQVIDIDLDITDDEVIKTAIKTAHALLNEEDEE